MRLVATPAVQVEEEAMVAVAEKVEEVKACLGEMAEVSAGVHWDLPDYTWDETQVDLSHPLPRDTDTPN